jgi:hypothetical protein
MEEATIERDILEKLGIRMLFQYPFEIALAMLLI